MFIYKITNIINGKVYVGKTTDTVESRWVDHQKIARQGEGYYFHNAIRKYGPSNFQTEILAVASSKEELAGLEKHFISLYDSRNSEIGYNLAPGGEGGMSYPGPRNPFFGKHHSEENKRLFAENAQKTHTGAKRSKETKQRMSVSAQGKVKSPEHCLHISEAKKGCTAQITEARLEEFTFMAKSKRSLAWKANISAALKGKVRSSEHCLHISQARKSKGARD
jgi:group I intron endonuclease